MGGDHEYGRGNASGDGSSAYGRGRRGYGDADPQSAAQPRGRGGRAYGTPQDEQGAYTENDRGYRGSDGSGGSGSGGSGDGRGYGQGQGGGGGRGYGQGGGGGRGYGPTPRGYDAPVDSYGGGGGAPGPGGNGQGARRRSSSPIPGEVVPNPGPDSTRRIPPPGQGGAGDGYPGAPGAGAGAGYGGAEPPTPRRSRVEERRAERSRTDVDGEPTEYAPGQERSTRYGRSVLDGRRTRNGAARTAGPGGPGGRGPGGRPVKKTGYHKYLDYPRTGKDGWRHWVPSIKQTCSVILGGMFLIIGLVAFEYATVSIPDEESIAASAQSTLYQYSDGSTFANLGQNRQNVDISQIPPMMQDALISIEDKTFKTNNGISYTGIVRSLLNDAEGKPLQGGSTLTQQFVKNAYLSQNQTFSRKFSEIFIALKIGRTKSKDWVMENYLNTVFFGRNAYGIQTGAQAWLGLDSSQLTSPADAAFMAALVNEPTTFAAGWDPTELQNAPSVAQADQAALKFRWTNTLKNMLSYGYITQAQYNTAIASFPTVVTEQTQGNLTTTDQQMQNAVNSWIDTYAANNPNSNIPSLQDIEQGGYTVVTTFNKQYMAMAQKAVQDQLLSKLSSKNWYDQNLYPALAAVDPKTGDLVAFYGGTTPYNWATQGQVQPGSSFKAFTLATAFEQNISPNSYIDGDSPWPNPKNPTEVAAANGDPKITNDDGSQGVITINKATANSVNTAFVRLADQVTYNAVLQTINKLGITNSNAQGLAANARLTLGIAAVSPARMADAYSTFADNGNEYPLIEVSEIKTASGQPWKPNDTPQQVLSPNIAETVTSTLYHVTHDPGATGYGATDEADLDNIVGKTGTSTMDMTTIKTYPALYAKTDYGYFNTAAVWFNGYTSNLETAVTVSRWVTEPNPKANQPGQAATVQIQVPVDNINGQGYSFGAQYPLSIWSEFMHEMQKTPLGGDPAFPTPNTSSMVIQNSPTASASASATVSAPASNTGFPTGFPSGGTSDSSSPCVPLFGGLGTCTSSSGTPSTPAGGGGTSSSSSSPSATSTRTRGGGGGF